MFSGVAFSDASFVLAYSSEATCSLDSASFTASFAVVTTCSCSDTDLFVSSAFALASSTVSFVVSTGLADSVRVVDST